MVEKQSERDWPDDSAHQPPYGEQAELDLGLVLDDDYSQSFAAEERRETRELSTPEPARDRWRPLNRDTVTELFGGYSRHLVGAANDTDTGIRIARALRDGKKLVDTVLRRPVDNDFPPVAPPLTPSPKDV